MKFKSFIAVTFTLVVTSVFANPPLDFAQAKKIASDIFAINPVTLYCGCHYDPLTNKIDLNSCGMQSASKIARAHRMEWEHIMPAENFGRQQICWREAICKKRVGYYKGRKCCEAVSSTFRRMEAELYNLWPSVGLVNQARSNYRYSEFSGISFNNSFYGCPIRIDKSLRKVEPRDEAKGIVARANLFMSEKYRIKLSASQKHLFQIWNRKYPPNDWEKEWAKKVAFAEGYTNSFIERNN